MNHQTPIIVGVVVGIVLLNVCLGFAWWAMRRTFTTGRSVEAADAKYTSPPSLFPMNPSHSTFNSPGLSTRSANLGHVAPGRAHILLSVHQEIRSDKALPSLPPVQLVSQYSDPISRHMLSGSENSSSHPNSSLQRGHSIRSVDSASLYSAASAPLSLHDRLFRRLEREPIPGQLSAPKLSSTVNALEGTTSSRASGMSSSTRVSMIREELAPETYDQGYRRSPLSTENRPPLRLQPKAKHRRRQSSTSDRIPPVPPIPSHLMIKPPLIPTYIASYTGHSRNRSYSESTPSTSFFSAHDYPLPVISPTDKINAPPKLPPRSPLRDNSITR